jgi:predicted porin
MRTSGLFNILFLTSAFFVLGGFAVQAHARDAAKEQELLRTIELQQGQLEAQQKQLDAQRKMLEEIQSQTQKLLENAQQEVDRLGDVVQQQQQQLESLQRQVSESQPPADKATVAADVPEAFEVRPVDKIVTSGGGERIKLAISGHVNRAVQVRDDGEDTDLYHVDNDNSESQVRFVGTAEVDEDLTLGTTIEVSIAPNISGQVDQNNQETGDIFDERKVEVTLDSKRWGKLWMGKGYTASYTAGAVDLSKTTSISYSTIVDTAGSHLFRDSSSGDLTNLRIFEAFNAFDGLNRRNRLRYDTPRFGGFHFATSAVSDNRYDASLWWGGQGYGFKAGAAAAFADPNQDDADFQYNGSASILHEDTGLNLSLSFGLLERDNQDDQQNYFAKVGWLRRFFDFGDTAFSVDYTRSLNLPTDEDDGYSIAAAAVQQFDKFGAEVYGLYRLHSLDRGVEPDVDDITVITLGTRVNF